MSTRTLIANYKPTGRQQHDPLPFGDLDRAGQAVLETVGARRAVRDGLACLAAKEVAALTLLAAIGDQGGLRLRLRQIAAGSLRAAINDPRDGACLGKAIAAKAIELAGPREFALAVLPREIAAAAAPRRRTRPDHTRSLRFAAAPGELTRYGFDGHVTTKVRFVAAAAA